jgi:hypothetical protein
MNGARHRSSLSPTLVRRLVHRPGKKEIVVPLGAILASKGPHHGNGQNYRFKQSALVRAAHIQTSA